MENFAIYPELDSGYFRFSCYSEPVYFTGIGVSVFLSLTKSGMTTLLSVTLNLFQGQGLIILSIPKRGC